tara:strand:+ start:265 stop:417 length:153 start_codon:yes stop_codon:yes gene_type:complete
MAKKNKAIKKMFISIGQSYSIDPDSYTLNWANGCSTTKLLSGQIVTYKNK